MAGTVIVTGGSRGIGRAIAARLAFSGHNIIFTYCNNEKAARETKQFLTDNYQISANYVKADFLSDNKGAAQRCFEMFDNEFPSDSFKGCVHNAGGMLVVAYWPTPVSGIGIMSN